TREKISQRGKNMTEIKKVRGANPGFLRKSKLHDDDFPPGTEYAKNILEGLIRVGEIANTKGEGHDVEGLVWEGNGDGISLVKLNFLFELRLMDFVFPLG